MQQQPWHGIVEQRFPCHDGLLALLDAHCAHTQVTGEEDPSDSIPANGAATATAGSPGRSPLRRYILQPHPVTLTDQRK